MKISVLLLTFDEAGNLPRCLDALLPWCDDVWAVDSGSTDGTLAILAARGVGVLHRPFDDFAGQRNYGLAAAPLRHEFVLHLDADEVVTAPFRAALDALLPAEGIDAYRVPSKLMLGERWLKHAGMYPTYQVRLGHRDRLRFVCVGHGQREDVPPHRVATFAEPYLHYNFSHGAAAWLRKHVRYAQDEAGELLQRRAAAAAGGGRLLSRDATERRRAQKRLAGGLPLALRPAARFVYVALVRRGVLDGRAGLTYALMLATYEAMIAICASRFFLFRAGAAPATEPAAGARPASQPAPAARPVP